jgi:ferredoxin/flavodoxin
MVNEFENQKDIVLNLEKRRIKLVYFSGTGGTAQIANYIEHSLESHGMEVEKESLDEKKNGKLTSAFVKERKDEDLLIIVYAVHAFDAPEPVYNWIRRNESRNNIPTAIISVSGGGEVWPNNASRSSCIKALERKGFKIFYERMIVMPSNWIVPTKEQLAVRLLKILPSKLDKTVSEILSGEVRRSKPQLSAKFISLIFKLEKPSAKIFAKGLKVRKTCTGCGWCAQNCPRLNIVIKDNRPSFGWRCIICLRCIYGCPQKSMYTRIFSFVVVKEGYDLKKLEERMHSIDLEPIEKHAPGYLYAGIREYLLNDK